MGATLGVAVAFVSTGNSWLFSPRSSVTGTGEREKAPGPAAYVDNKICLGCHLEVGRQWESSHHAKAMALARGEIVRGDFGDRTFTHRGVTSRFFRRGDRFFVNTEGPSGEQADFEIKYTFGLEPLQQYLVEMPGGRLQPLSVAWDGPKKRWFHLLPDEETPPGDILHWTGRYQTANTMCLVCHTTRFEKRYDAATDTFSSRWAEPNVSCQACHGPGERHVQWERSQRGAGTPARSAPGEPRGLTVDIRSADARQKVELCAPCHSRRGEISADPAPGQPLLDNFTPSLLVQGLYFDDGQQREEVYVDASFRQSRMFQSGVVCTDCHNPHTGKLRHPGNAVCTQCHRADPNPSFPRATGNFDSPAHHFHKQGSRGAECAGCHMPSRTYMQIQARPDHSIRVPRPDLSVKIGTPNACTNCHANKTAEWAAALVARWYGPMRRQEAHYGEAFANARSARPGGNEGLVPLVSNLQIAAVVRASALADLSQDGTTGAVDRVRATRDSDPEVRAAAAASAEGLPIDQRIAALGPLLADRVRAVRIAAARVLSAVPSDRLTPEMRSPLKAALAEYVAAQAMALDMPGAHFNLAVVYENTGQRDLALQHYRSALKIDPDFTAARANLAVLYSVLSRNGDAERVLVEGLKRRPEIGELQYSLGLLLAEEKRMSEATDALGKAARLMPDRADVHYNHGLALQETGRTRSAETALLAAQRLNPADPAAPYALAILYEKSGRHGEALDWAERLRSLRPADPQVARLVASLRGNRR